MGGDKNAVVPIRLVRGLPFISVEVSANKRTKLLHDVLLDTGSASCVFSADTMIDVGLVCSPEDELYIVSGIGGEEYVFSG